jgi:uncharacterized protein (UPF0548 family)
MISWRMPSGDELQQFLAARETLGYTYQHVGATDGALPAGFTVDRSIAALGTGERTYEAAKAALREWAQFRLGWVRIWPQRPPIAAGTALVVLARVGPQWWANPTRIAYVVDEPGERPTFGFAYGTLPGHAETGEERFTVSWDRPTDEVSYEILAFSRPQHRLARIGYPLTRRLQRRFARDSCAAMRRAVVG